jgi:hypothetical protein
VIVLAPLVEIHLASETRLSKGLSLFSATRSAPHMVPVLVSERREKFASHHDLLKRLCRVRSFPDKESFASKKIYRLFVVNLSPLHAPPTFVNKDVHRQH